MCFLVQEAGIYLRHELEAHALAYKAIKALPGTPPVFSKHSKRFP